MRAGAVRVGRHDVDLGKVARVGRQLLLLGCSQIAIVSLTRRGEDDPLVKGQLGSGTLQRPRIERRDDFEEGEELDVEAGGFEGGGQGFGLMLGPGDGDPHPLAPSPIALPPDRERGNVVGTRDFQMAIRPPEVLPSPCGRERGWG